MRKAIAIDFDGCLCTDAYPEIGEPSPGRSVLQSIGTTKRRGFLQHNDSLWVGQVTIP